MMNRRTFLGQFFAAGATALYGTPRALANAGSNINPETPLQPIPPTRSECIFPGALIRNAEILIHDIRDMLSPYGLMNVAPEFLPEDKMMGFNQHMLSLYTQMYNDEDRAFDIIDDVAGNILNDPNCYVPDAPLTGCTHYEAPKYFSGQRALELYPLNTIQRLSALSEENQLRVVEGTVGYSAMLMDIFPEIIEWMGIGDTLAEKNHELDMQRYRMETILASAQLCPLKEPFSAPAVRSPETPAPLENSKPMVFLPATPATLRL